MNKTNNNDMRSFATGFVFGLTICGFLFIMFSLHQLNANTLNELEREIETKQDMIEKMQEYDDYFMITWIDNNQTYAAEYSNGLFTVVNSERGEIVSRLR